jgi:uncharacterized damage-inducible protein DinB
MRRLRETGLCALLLSVVVVLELHGIGRAQQPASSVFSDVTRSAWYDVNALLIAAAKKMPDEHYSFRPVKSARSFGEIVGHLASEHYAICAAVTGRRVPPGQLAELEKLTSKDALVGALQDSVALCDMAYGLLTDENAAFTYTVFNTVRTRLGLLTDTITHDNEHYGNLATYMRLKGVSPPSGGQ